MVTYPETWWKAAVVYQIYPISFFDSNGDGSDYRDIDPRYGTLKDWDNLLASLHGRGIKLMMDLVVNHTSDEHEWFIESKSSKTNPKRDWYIWPQFQGSVWEYDGTTDEYYLHLYHTKQPDLNWENPQVRQLFGISCAFGSTAGVTDFACMDVINLISKADGLPDAPVKILETNIKTLVHSLLMEYDLITVGETPFTHSAAELARYVLPANEELNMVFHFELVDLDSPRTATRQPFIYRPWKLSEFKEIVNRWQRFKREEGFWNAVFIENHDQGRSVTRWGNDADEWRSISAKMLAVLEVTLGGTQYVFQGQEIGIRNFPRSWGIKEYKDVATQNFYRGILDKRRRESGGDEESVDMSDVIDDLQKKARDHGRIPMQWNSSAHAGFTTGAPWMRVNDDYPTWNAAVQLEDPQSVHAFWKQALQLRKEHKVLIYGDFQDLAPQHEEVFAYRRAYEGRIALIILNFTDGDVVFHPPFSKGDAEFRLVFGNYNTEKHVAPEVDAAETLNPSRGDAVALHAYEGRVYLSNIVA
ncbi:glycoside hydrolase family 13 protein [Mycena galopus ATCC 62051]|nr:glycoside hydrolase family 13 protein [Mycena galopus ATCC 62051]